MLPVKVAHRLITALVDNDTAVLDTVLPANAYLQVRGNGRMQIYWTRPRVRAALLAEFARWHNPTMTIGDITPHTNTITVTFQVEVMKNGRIVKHDYFALLIPQNGQIQTMILYCYHEVACAPAGIWSLSFPSDHAPPKRTAFSPRLSSFAC